MFPTILIFFLFGLIIGSFLNVVLFRTEKNGSLGGRSHCRSCGALIHWYDNIPLLSFILLRGQCRKCGVRISFQYPLVELATGLLFGLSGLLVFRLEEPSSWLVASWWCFLFSVLLLISVYDLGHMEIPLSFLLFGVGGGVVYLIGASWFSLGQTDFLSWPLSRGLLGGGLAALFFYLLVWMSRERWMGMGDVWLAFIAGLAVGPTAVLFLLTLSFTLGALVAIVLLIMKKKELSSQIPFAPYLCVATVLLLLIQVLNPPWLYYFLFPGVSF
ncbi:MAG: prepilin peptidase [Candidatus Moraniibacteriota bacterium]